MSEPTTRETVLARLLAAAQADPRVVGLVDAGSGGEGRDDRWSDIDAAIFLRDEDREPFAVDWKRWAAGFGRLLLTFIGPVEHPWAVFDAEPVPLRVDFAFWRASEAAVMLGWPNSPLNVAAFVLYDGTGGKLQAIAERLVGQDLGPGDQQERFERVCGAFWYYLLRTHASVVRGRRWAARYDYNFVILGNLMALLRLEGGAVSRWRSRSAAVDLEREVAPERVARLEACLPGREQDAVLFAMQKAAALGYDISAAIASAHGWEWPQELGERVKRLLAEPLS